MKKTYIFLLLAIMVLGAKAQILNGDLDGDSKLTKNDVDLLVKDVLTGNKRNMKSDVYNPFITDQMFISGCWWTDKYNYIEFKPSGINYEGKDYKYEYFPFLGHILLYDEYDYPVKAIYVMDKDAESLTLRTSGIKVMTKYYRNRPVYLVQSITLEKTSVSIGVGESEVLKASVLPTDADCQDIEWISSDESIVKVSSDGTVTGISNGNAIITATAKDEGKVQATCEVGVRYSLAGHNYVDLGLSVKWATMNIGARKPGDFGDYFAWGATEPQDVYDWAHTPYQTQNDATNYSSVRFTKYSGTGTYRDENASDEDALKTVLDPEDDAAHVNWGSAWRMPTKEEFDELVSNCTWQWTEMYGEKGYKVRSRKNSNYIFLPAAGYASKDNIYTTVDEGRYWSSSLDRSKYRGYSLFFESRMYRVQSYDRNYGYTIRPVCP